MFTNLIRQFLSGEKESLMLQSTQDNSFPQRRAAFFNFGNPVSPLMWLFIFLFRNESQALTRIKRNLLYLSCSLGLLLFTIGVVQGQVPDFTQSNLNFNGNGGVSNGTSLMFGPDDRLYVLGLKGQIDIFTIERLGENDYVVTDAEELLDVLQIPNHNDDGSSSGTTQREATGITVAGTASNPVIYATSSDPRVGGPSGDKDLDTNSGVITRFTWNGSSWDVVDIVRGLPRSEENHATNGLEFVTINGTDYLIVCSGGHANAGAPSDNFAWTTEYALSAAVLSVNLTMLEGMPINTDGGRQYIYDLPTLDDPTRPNANGITDPDTPGYDGIDVGDPWGGNDGLNQAMIVENGPVQIFSAGYRNTYDLVITQDGKVYNTDNGANGGWGGLPVNEGIDGTVTNDYDPSEPGSSSSVGGEQVNNQDHLTMITDDIQSYTFGSFYGGHPVPVRANVNAGLFTNPEENNYNPSTSVFRTLTYDPDGSRPGSTTDASIALPANWPPVPASLINPVEGDWRGPGINNPDGPNDVLVTTWGTNTNGIDEYTASNFGGAMQGDLIAGKNNGILRRVELKSDGSLENLTSNFVTNLGGNPLGITCNGDADPFPGTIWVATFNSTIKVLEPVDGVGPCYVPGDDEYEATADNDDDGYTNQDEIDNKDDDQTVEDVICVSASQPNDFDKEAGAPLISDLNDPDDDADGIDDVNDPFQLGDPLDSGSDAFDLPVVNELLSDNPVLKGYLGLGFTGMMNNGEGNGNWLNWLDDRDNPNDPNPNDILGGAVGAMTMQMTAGTALGNANSQEKAFQYGVNVDQSTGEFIVTGRIFNLDMALQLYDENNNGADGELGIFLGDGTQSNYIKFVISQAGLEVLEEVNDNTQETLTETISTGDRPSNDVVFFLKVNPANGEVTAEYSFDGATPVSIGSVTAQGSVLTAIQQASTPLAVGLIGSSNQAGAEVEGTWDFLNVISTEPFVTNEIPDQNVLINAPNSTFNLDNFFDDDGGTNNLTYTVQNNTNTLVNASISGSTLTIDFPNEEASATITIRATDDDNLFAEQTFNVEVLEDPEPLVRIRANGATIAATDDGPDWLSMGGANAQSGSFQGINYGVNTGNLSTHNIGGRDASVPDYVPQSLFANERWDPPAAPEMEWTFDLPNGDYLVRLYMGNGFSGTSQPGQRVFDISIEGQLVQNDLDLSATFGHQVGGMLEFPVPLTDGTLNILFEHVVENPTVNGIEILGNVVLETPIVINNTIPNQSNAEGDQLDASLVVEASGGDGNLNYSAQGLPPGIDIEPTNGNIFGTVSAGAAANSPYAVTITVDDSDGNSADAQTLTFNWNISIGATPAMALIEVTPNTNNINASTFGGGSFQITNSSPSANITSVSFNMSTGFLPNMVFDPNGTAGDATAKGFTVNQGVGGSTTPTFSLPLGNGGFQGLDIDFTDFAPNETFTFSVDQDPISIEGLSAPGPGESGSVSGLEQVGSTVTVSFSDGSSYTTNLYSDGSNAGATSKAKANLVTAPTLAAVGLTSPATTNNASQTIQISGGPANGTVSLLQVEGAYFVGNNNPTQAPFEVNSVISVNRTTGIQLDGSGNASVAVTLTDSDTDGGYNYFIAAVEDGSEFGLTSNAVILEYDDQFVPPPSEVLYRVNAGGALVAASDAPNPDWSGDTGNAGAGSNSPYLAAVSSGNSTYNQGAGSAYQGPIDMSDPSLPAGTPDVLFTTERFDADSNPEMKWEFPIAEAGDIEVRLYFAELFNGIDAAGERVFDVSVEGTVPAAFNDIDPFARNGALGAFMLSHTVNVSDGTLDLEFIHGVENPAIKAIEILSVPGGGGMNNPPMVTNPGNQVNEEGETINLDIMATDNDNCGGLTYGATGLPPSLTIDPNTGVISGTLDETVEGNGGTEGAFIESNGIVVIEMESADNLPNNWETISSYSTTFSPNVNNPGGATGGDFIVWQAGQSLGTPGNGQITYQVEINNPGTYQFKWRNQVGNGTETTEHNDTWLKIEADAFYGSKNNGNSIVCPNGAPSSNDCSSTTNLNGSSSNGWFKIYSSGANNWSWSTNTSDNDAHQIFARFDQAGTYNILVSARSSSHVIDRMVLVNQSQFGGNGEALSIPESDRVTDGNNGTPGASANSPYDVTITVTDDCDPAASTSIDFQWFVNPTGTTTDPSALVQVTAGSGLTSSTFGNNSFQITNTGDVDITNVTINTTSGFLPDVVFDPVGKAGDNGAKCLTEGSASVGDVGITVPANGGSDNADCVSVFAQPHNGVDDEEGYDEMTLDFTDFNPNEVFAFGVDMDPTSIKGDLSTGDAGSISGFELIGATVTITFADGTTLQSNLWDEGSLGGSQAVVAANPPTPAPTISAQGIGAGPAQVSNLNQTINVTGPANASVTLLQVDGRLYIDPGNPNIGYDVDPFEANEAVAKVLYTATLDGNGMASIPVTLLQTAGSNGAPDGGINHFIAVVNGTGDQTSMTSNTIVLEYTDAPAASLTLTANLQAHSDHSGDYAVKLYPVGSNVADYEFSVTADANGEMTITGIEPGTYQVAVKYPNSLQAVETITIAEGSNSADMGTLPMGDANNDNFITALDFSILSGAFNTQPGDGTYDSRADFNGDSVVTALDFSVLSGNFNTAGEEPEVNVTAN